MVFDSLFEFIDVVIVDSSRQEEWTLYFDIKFMTKIAKEAFWIACISGSTVLGDMWVTRKVLYGGIGGDYQMSVYKIRQ